MFTTVAFSKAVAVQTALGKLDAVSDQHIKTSGTTVTVGAMNNIVGAYALVGLLGTEARLISPSLRRTNPLYITPIDLAIVPPTDPAMMYHPANPVLLDVNESLEAEEDGTIAAATEQHLIGVFMSDGALSPVTGEIFTINANIALGLEPNSWEFSEITFPDSLPVADYTVVGARLVAANGILFRFVPVGAVNRPGGVSANAVDGKDPWNQRFGRMGDWFSFNTVQPPGIEVIGSVTTGSATYELYIDAIKT